jgi:hypothetical protein
MNSPSMNQHIDRLRKAFNDKNLTLYLGAGASVGSELPSWDKLVLAMYFSAMEAEAEDRRLRPFPNYLYAIAEWHLGRRREPLDITARKVRRMYEGQDFIGLLKDTLYGPFKLPDGNSFHAPDADSVVHANATLASAAKLCAKPSRGRRGVSSVVTYNYDNLLEIALRHDHLQPIWKANQEVARSKLPIYHVHGYVPLEGEGSNEDEIIFTEEQYYLASHNAYAWSNLVQIKCMSSSLGLMVGLSLTDRNMRRLLDALTKTPLTSENYVLLKKPRWPPIKDGEIADIDRKARDYYTKFSRSGIKRENRRLTEVRRIVTEVERRDVIEETATLISLGVRPIWYRDYQEIPQIIEKIIS